MIQRNGMKVEIEEMNRLEKRELKKEESVAAKAFLLFFLLTPHPHL